MNDILADGGLHQRLVVTTHFVSFLTIGTLPFFNHHCQVVLVLELCASLRVLVNAVAVADQRRLLSLPSVKQTRPRRDGSN